VDQVSTVPSAARAKARGASGPSPWPLTPGFCDEVIDHHSDLYSSCGSSLTRLTWAPKTDPTLIKASLSAKLAKVKHHEAYASSADRPQAQPVSEQMSKKARPSPTSAEP